MDQFLKNRRFVTVSLLLVFLAGWAFLSSQKPQYPTNPEDITNEQIMSLLKPDLSQVELDSIFSFWSEAAFIDTTALGYDEGDLGSFIFQLHETLSPQEW